MNKATNQQKARHLIDAYDFIQEIEHSNNDDEITAKLSTIKYWLETVFPTMYQKERCPTARKIAENVNWYIVQIFEKKIEFAKIKTALRELIRECAVQFETAYSNKNTGGKIAPANR